MTAALVDGTAAQRRCAPCAAAFFGVWSIVFGPLTALVAVAITIYVFLDGTYSRARRRSTAASCVFALAATTLWFLVMAGSGLY